MGFELKIKAKEDIRHHYLYYSFICFALFALKHVILLLPLFSFLLYFLKNESIGNIYTILYFTLCFLCWLCIIFLYEIITVLKNKRDVANDLNSKTKTVFRCFAADVTVFVFKAGLRLFLLCPFFLLICAATVMSENGCLYIKSVIIFSATCLLLFITAVIFSGILNSVFRCVKLVLTESEDISVRETLKLCFKHSSAYIKECAVFELSLYPWYFLSFIPVINIYSLAYVERCRTNLNLYMADKMLKNTEYSMEICNIKIYSGKGLPIRSIKEI